MNYQRDELEALGLAALGLNVAIHRSVLLFAPERISIGSNVRIDCFSVLSAGKDGIYIGNHVHLGAGAYLFGSGGCIVLEDFSGISSRVALYTATDDYSEGYLTNPTLPDAYRKVTQGPVVLRKHAIVGSGSVILPNLELGVGSSVGALSLVHKQVEPFAVVHGNPIRVIGKRSDKILELEASFVNSLRTERD